MDTGLSEKFIFLRGEVQGKHKLNSATVNPLLRKHRKLLESFKIKETARNGIVMFQVSVLDVDEFVSELSEDKKILLFSYKLKLNVLDTPPRIQPRPNHPYNIHARIHEAFMKIRLEDDGIAIVTTGFKVQGDYAEGHWPTEKMVGIGI